MAKGKNKNKNQVDEDQDFGKKKKNVITQELLMDKSNMDFTEFIPLLPEDVLYPPFKISETSTKGLLKILTDMNYLLYLQPKNFWATVTYNISFGRCLSSCLSQLSVRWMNKYQYLAEEQDEFDSDFNYRMIKDLDAYAYTEALEEVLLKIVFRIMSFQEEDPRLNEIYNFGQNTIKKLNVFNYIKLMELIQIYGEKQENNSILKTISKNFLKTLPNPYKYFTEILLPHIVKKLQQTNRDLKMVSDRQEFGVNYSYTRMNAKTLSPGEEQLKRKVTMVMNYLSFMKIVKNTKLISEEILDHLYFNSQLNHVLENAFYQLDAAYKVWNFQGVDNRLLPMINRVIVEIVDYFVEYFNRVNERIVKRTSKTNVEAYVRSLERLFVDYGKRYYLGKKGGAVRNMTLFKLILKKIDLIQIMQDLYLDEDDNKTFDFNMEYLIDFKLAIQDCYKQDNYIHQNEARQHQIQEETQIPDDVDINDIQNPLHKPNLNNQQAQESEEQQSNKITFTLPKNDDNLEFMVSKKQRDDDYYEQLYLKQRQRFKIEYEDEYDDLVDYNKRPLFMDSASSDSQSEEEIKMQRLVSNENNQKANQLKHIKFEEKQKEIKKQNKYTKVSKEQKESMTTKNQNLDRQTQRQDGKVRYVARQIQRSTQDRQKFTAKQKNNDTQKPSQKPRGNQLEDMLESQKMPHQGEEFDEEQDGRGGNQGGRGGNTGHKRRFVPRQNNDSKNFNDKGRNSNKNRQHGNPTNQSFGGGKKYKSKY